MKKNIEFMRLKEVMDITTLSRSTIYRKIEEGSFPRQVSLGGNTVVWVKSQIQDWCLEKVKAAQVVA